MIVTGILVRKLLEARKMTIREFSMAMNTGYGNTLRLLNSDNWQQLQINQASKILGVNLYNYYADGSEQLLQQTLEEPATPYISGSPVDKLKKQLEEKDAIMNRYLNELDLLRDYNTLLRSYLKLLIKHRDAEIPDNILNDRKGS
jgi:hypothetical protein